MPAGSPATEAATARVALARARGACTIAAADPQAFSLVVDLAAEPVGARWLRGAATLALLCGAALSLAPGMDVFSTAYASTPAPGPQYQMNQMLSGGPAESPESASDPWPHSRPAVASSSSVVRIQGPVTKGLYWSLRSAGVTPQAASEYLYALSTRIDVGSDVAPYDRFDLVISRAEGQPLLYAALHRVASPDVELMKWTTSGKTDWFDTEASGAERSDGLMSPVTGRVTSGYGYRVHPILRFARMHAGIDFGAARGSPVVAAAEGVVVGAGWSGGYGRQVQVAHGSGLVTTYSHMSGLAASLGDAVRQGQVIGYVGSTGLSTGTHLHFEVRINGRAVDPLHVQMQRRQILSFAERKAFKARLKLLMAIGEQA